MYEALDSFLRVSTWHTTHSLDDERFHRALNAIVRKAQFTPEGMRAYMHHYLGDKASMFESEIERRVRQADTIAGFLFDIGEREST